MSSIQKQLLDYTKTTIEALSLTGLDSVVVRKFPFDTKLTGKVCVISPTKENKIETATNAAYDTGYGVIVAFYHPDDAGRLDVDENAFYLWRESTVAAFIDKRVATITPVVYKTTIEPGPVMDLGVFRKNKTAQSLVIRFWVRRNRPGV
ncbi:MAG: hypothetical protein HN975_02015 [Anaerolineae bacterium]|jgi:hypothetical protein|nr:hypothetical protein [Anaerolineae bacterium]